MWNPDGVAWRKMPAELVKPFLAQGKSTRKQYLVLALGAALLIKLGVPMLA